MSNKDIIYIRNNNRYGGSRSFAGKTPPVANRAMTKGRFSDNLFNIGQVYYSQTAQLREHNQAIESIPNNNSSEYRKLIAPFIAQRNQDIAKAKATNPKKWWTPKWVYFGDLCEACGTVKRGKDCPLALEH